MRRPTEPSRVDIGWRLAVITASTALVAACHARMEVLRPVSTVPTLAICDGGCGESLTLTYLGTSGFIIRSGNHAILTGPLLSNPPITRVIGPARTVSDGAYIDSVLGRHPVSDVDAILIGHSHYDHLMDVPYVARRHATRAIIYGTPTMGHILHGDSALRPYLAVGDSGRYRVIDSTALGSRSRMGRWWRRPGSPFRFMALEAEHAPNIFDYRFADGVITTDLASLPTTVSGWKLGESFAYVIEVVRDDGSVAFRLYYMDAISQPPLGFPPAILLADSIRFDAIILTAGNYEKVEAYPTALLNAMHPRLTILAHWEDFFRSQREELRLIPFLKPDELVRRVEGALPSDGGWVTPKPGTSITLCRCR